MKKINILILTGMLSMSTYAEEMAIEASSEVEFEAGIGVNYALLGVTANKSINSKIELFAGLGLGYVVGGRYYFNDSVRFTANYGTNSIIQKILFGVDYNYTYTVTEYFEGTNLGIGYISSKKNGWSIDLMYSDISKANDRTKELTNEGYTFFDNNNSFEKITLSLGYRW
ncbi:hypothetical protein [uncultured Gammaproteobacteria bacterium]|jgi:hypothetical protein|nr:hypothetical protein [uncultured Gammaproteobacteria bacterium]CAC9549456.1 hypothetical protein [uncultured Gammaproteobacteria bacterium]CAC9560250.1 hypothetical protein [uncultured Gammaproteobacteria bacterium]CAC9573129.1 hypothetical protein [uncultured Gammaproteobacteria bacterium]CAC9578065.1 hypothetical protein [uncultured Gammaproteobacteria bacterium]